MSWSFSMTGTPAAVKAGFKSYIDANPLEGHEKVTREKVVDQISEAGKGYSADWLMEFSTSGSATLVDGNEVNVTSSASITPVPA